VGKMVEVTASDGRTLGVYRADPTGSPRGAIVLIQEIFGVNGHIRKVCDGYAADGYVCVAPAVFDRVSKDIQLGYGPDDVKVAMETRAKLNWDDVLKDVEATKDAVADVGKVGVIGYCFGGSVAWLAATRLDFACAVSYYGGNVADFADEKPKCSVICHIGAQDKAITAEKVGIIRSKRPEVEIFIYDGAPHAFNNDAREGSYHAPSAKLARERTITFLEAHIG
jgi:carboxymethylenebutenolidase